MAAESCPFVAKSHGLQNVIADDLADDLMSTVPANRAVPCLDRRTRPRVHNPCRTRRLFLRTRPGPLSTAVVARVVVDFESLDATLGALKVDTFQETRTASEAIGATHFLFECREMRVP